MALNLALIALIVAAFVWWAVTYEENEDHKVTEDHKRRSRKISRVIVMIMVAWAIVNIVVYST